MRRPAAIERLHSATESALATRPVARRDTRRPADRPRRALVHLAARARRAVGLARRALRGATAPRARHRPDAAARRLPPRGAERSRGRGPRGRRGTHARRPPLRARGVSPAAARALGPAPPARRTLTGQRPIAPTVRTTARR